MLIEIDSVGSKQDPVGGGGVGSFE